MRTKKLKKKMFLKLLKYSYIEISYQLSMEGLPFAGYRPSGAFLKWTVSI